MGLVISWWLVVEILGLVGTPLASVICANLPDRGWALSKPLSLLIVGWLIWFPLSVVTALPYSAAWITGTFVGFAAINLLLLRQEELKSNLYRLITHRPLYIATTEAVFAAGFLFLAWVRSFNPAVAGTEKFMDVAFLSSLVRTQHLPPPDPWLSGAPINYYYFGHFLLASIAKVLGTQPGTAFNLGIAVICGLVATAVFGVSVNLAAILRADKDLYRALPFGLFSMLLVLVLGNLNGAQIWWQQVLQWLKTPAGHGQSALSWLLQRNLWLTYHWWDPSRVIPGTINEFPSFSFVLSDLHAHVLALPFDTLAVALALNLMVGRGRGMRAFGTGREGLYSLFGAGIVIGSLYVINGWDLPTYLGLALLALACQQWQAHGRRLDTPFLLDLATPAVILTALVFLLYLPFYREFVSPSQGIGVVPVTDHSPIGDEISIFGLPLFLAGSLLFLWGIRRLAALLPEDIQGPTGIRPFWGSSSTLRLPPKLQAGLLLGLALAVLAFLTLRSQQAPDWTLFWCLLLLGACVALALGHVLPGKLRSQDKQSVHLTQPDAVSEDGRRAELFILILIGTSAALIGACELVFVRDIFDDRMNTVFKLYYQSWLLLGICGGPALWLLLSSTRRTLDAAMATVDPERKLALAGMGLTAAGIRASRAEPASSPAGGPPVDDPKTPAPTPKQAALLPKLQWAGAAGILLWVAILVVLIGAALIYPVLATSAVTNNFTLAPGTQATLDGTAFMASQPADACTPCATCPPYSGTDRNDNQAILWLNTHVQGSPVILEAPGCEWSYYSRISAFTGLPTLIGWPGGHEGEWRINWIPEQHEGDILDQRAAVTNEIYTSSNEGTVLALLRQYHVRYVYVGQLERNLYVGANLNRFGQFLHLVYNRDGVSIYAVP
ncbi:MAG: DUF2298 domain-containing protein [Ktedonobacterales bacterium]